MREYDDENIRLYTPVLQRVIILLAVIIAVPVVMWTITTVVRTYVAPPKVPTFQRMTENQPADTASDATQAAPAPAPAAGQPQSPAASAQMADARTTAPDAHPPLLDIRKPADAQPAAANTPAAAPQIATATQPPVANPPTAHFPAGQAPAVQPMTAASAPPITVAAPPAPAAPSPPIAAMQASAANPGGAAAPAAPAGNLAWPNPNSKSPPQVGTNDSAKDTVAASGPTSFGATGGFEQYGDRGVAARRSHCRPGPAASAPADALCHGPDRHTAAKAAPGGCPRRNAEHAGRRAVLELRSGPGAGALLAADFAQWRAFTPAPRRLPSAPADNRRP